MECQGAINRFLMQDGSDRLRKGDSMQMVMVARSLGSGVSDSPKDETGSSWFQQFDAQLMDMLVDVDGPSQVEEPIFQYDPDGWKLSNRGPCSQCQYFNVHKSKYFDPKSSVEYPPDCPAHERAVACLGSRK